jgi:hypothetical protein
MTKMNTQATQLHLYTSPLLSSALATINEIESRLAKNDPSIRLHLANIHKQLIAHDELVHMLVDYDPKTISVIMSGQQEITNTVLAQAAKPKTSKASLSKLSLDDI